VGGKAEVIVVGLGAMGSATCLALAASGVDVTGIDQYEPPHPYGSTHTDTRITRLAVGEGPDYVPLVHRSHELWRELERRTGAELLTQCGGLVIAPADNAFLNQTREVARRYGISHQNLSNAELLRRYPMFAAKRHTEAYYEPDAGYVRPEAAVATQLALARRNGAKLRVGERVQDWSASSSRVTVHTKAGIYDAQHLVLCVGAWLPEQFPEGHDVFAVYRQLQYWFPFTRGYEALRDMPVFVWDFGGERSGFTHLLGFYGFPAVDGPAGGVKVAIESYDQRTAPDGRQHPASEAEIDRMYRDYIEARMPWLGAEPVRTVSCLYTSTRGCRFVIDRHPAHERVLIVSPCSGHGFKHSAAIGEAVAQQLTGATSEIDLSVFSLARARQEASSRSVP
jgi:sarcosine oxidase